ncbi:hypothetical protein V492_07948 [Pseudogymnoascus sp. VKM F-4246]|nr:hypothetical protein V492_07948 [Pseudogymnoascus sp. VKM F-4246]
MVQSSSPDLEYWTDCLRERELCIFPTLNDNVERPNERHNVEVITPDLTSLNIFCQEHDLKLVTVFQAAWALVLRCYTGLDDVCFGYSEDSHELLPSHATFSGESGLRHALDSLESTLKHGSNYKSCSIEDIEDALELGRGGIFNTAVRCNLMGERPNSSTADNQTNGQQVDVNGNRDCENEYMRKYGSHYIIVVNITLYQNSVTVALNYQLSCISKGQAANIASALERAVLCVLNGALGTVGDQHLFSDYHREQVDRWNQNRPEWTDLTLHEAMATQVKIQPDATAVRAWDEEWTYRELDVLSSSLAQHLVDLGVKPGMRIPLVFERSGWWVIALLAVSKAGGAFVPIDVTQPILRIKDIIKDVEPQFLLSSNKHSALLADSVKTTVIVSKEGLEKLSSRSVLSPSLPKVSSKDVAYVIYTSGSTGRPKGAMLPHGGFLSSLIRWFEDTPLGPGSMALQASSYAWTVSIIETICSLWKGACLCVPSDHSRQNEFASVFNEMKITWAILSPSIIKTVPVESVQYLRSLILCGEPVSQEIAERWSSERTKVWVCWGATEAPIFTRTECFTPGTDIQNLGYCRPLCRIVEVGNHERLVPVGAVGEIVIHAPWSSIGYLNDPEKTAAKFLDRPDWLNGQPSSYGSRWFKVGDLVRQNSDGTLVLAGRGDNMVKIRGQRFDMSEVENHLAGDDKIRNSLPILPKVGICKQRLVAVISLHEFCSKADDNGKGEIAILKGQEMQKAATWLSAFRGSLSKRIPSYMIPTIWIMVQSIPLTITGKIDRVTLKRFVEKMDVKTFDDVSMLGVEREAPTTPMEKRLQKIWAEILHLPVDKIGRNQTFISLGGDSILAMIVGSRCRDKNLSLRAQDILKFGTIAELASHTATIEETTQDELVMSAQFKRLRASIKSQLHRVGVTNIANIEDAYPCSPMQQGLLLSKARLTGDYNTSHTYEIVPHPGATPCIKKLKDSWQQVVDRHSSLRTFFVESALQAGSFDQVVLQKYNSADSVITHECGVIEQAEDAILMFKDKQLKPYENGRPPHSLTILHTGSNRLFFRMDIEHTLVDGRSIAIIMRDLIAAYDGDLELRAANSYSSYAAILQHVDSGIDNKYWKTYLDGMHPCVLPDLSHSSSRKPQESRPQSLAVKIENPEHLLKFCQSQGITLSALFRTIWGLVLRAYTGSDEVCFGFITSGRDVPIQGVNDTVGTFINMLVCRMNLAKSNNLKDIISAAHSDYLSSLPHQHASLAQIQHQLGLQGQRLFNTAMTVLKQDPQAPRANPLVDFNLIHEWSLTEYDLDVQVWVSNNHIKMELWYKPEWVSSEHAHNIASTFNRALEVTTDDLDQRVGNLDLFGEQHRRQVWDWNSIYPDTIATCLHDLVERQALKRPQAIAVHSWDRDLTFSQLDEYSNVLANNLVLLGVGPEIRVLLCFEKSALAIVAMLGILKAGGVCVPIDPKHPVQRLQRILNDVKALYCLVSPTHRELFEKEALVNQIPHIVTVEETLLASQQSLVALKACHTVNSENAAFVIFTSGSTGTPKGIVHPHQTVASSLYALGNIMKIGSDSRTLQFSAFVFDVSLTEIFLSLTHGGVLCVPSEDERMNNLESAIVRMNVNWAHLTPTVASFLNPEAVPTLTHMALAGEPLKKVNLTEWAEKVALFNVYGPAECALVSTVRPGLSKNDRPDNIGEGIGLLTWLVDPSNADCLVPVGGVGEMLLEGPNVAREYLGDKDGTLASFIENPSWLRGDNKTPHRRLYKSGDLARYNGDGSIQLLGRKDTQVKIHGQRVELTEVEYQLRMSMPKEKITNVAVVYAKLEDHPGGGLLAAFLELEEKSPEVDINQLMLDIPQRLRQLLARLDANLAAALPTYMVPSIYAPLNTMPLLTSGKIDRKRLSQIAAMLSTEQVRLYSSSEFQSDKRKPRTIMERNICSLWAEVLNIDKGFIGIDDSLLRLGGDSVVVMRLAAAARGTGITISVGDIFQHPKLSEMAYIAKPVSERTLQALDMQYGISRSEVQDIYPCSPLQDGLMLLSSKQEGMYLMQHAFQLPSKTNMAHFREAWEAVYRQLPVLRTRIVHVEKSIGSMQVVMSGNIQWHSATSLETYLEEDKSSHMSYGRQLTRFCVVDDHDKQVLYFVFTAHHSIFDSRFLDLLFAEVESAYGSLSSLENLPSLNITPYKSFAQDVFHSDISTAESFWNSLFSGLSFSTFPKAPSNKNLPVQRTLDYSINFPTPIGNLEYPFSMIIRAAWALILAQYSDSSDNVVFGMTLDGLDANELDVAPIAGPTMATVPVKVTIDSNRTVGDFLRGIINQANAMGPFKHFGLQNIRGVCSDAAKACNFQSLLAIHPIRNDHKRISSLLAEPVKTHNSSSTYLLEVECQINETGTAMTAQYDELTTSTPQMTRILQQFEHVIRQLVANGATTMQLKDIQFHSPQDAMDIASWNRSLPPLLDTCVHDIISGHAKARPDSTAVCSWDESLSYRELDELSTTFAHHLVKSFNIGPESLVPLLFSKSAWAVVAMVAVLKAGAGYVPMDPSHPPSRLKEIVDATQASVILCSPENDPLSRSLARASFVVSRKTMENSLITEDYIHTYVKSNNVAYVIFTSGSTGVPKGIVVEHEAFCTAASEHGKRTNLNADSRVIHFSSYAFEACILEILTTLFNGGCVCVAPEDQRLEDIAKTMRDLHVNWAFFTPSFIRTIRPDQVPELKTLVLGGEALGVDNIDVWVDHCHLINGYGPSETIVFSIINEHVRRGTTPDSIGRPVGGACWIVDPEDHSKLAPLGGIGELLIEGPTLARGYLNDADRTRKAFVQNPKLVSQSVDNERLNTNGCVTNGHTDGNTDGKLANGSASKPARGRMYKTGDLVRYDCSGNADGAILFVGRKDTQVKIRGQRMELGEIEHHLKSHLKIIQHVAIEQVDLEKRNNRYLIAFFSFGSPTLPQLGEGGTPTVPMSSDLKALIVAAEAKLSEALPTYMIPTLYVPLLRMPLLSSGKTHRRKLHEIAAQLSESEISQYSLADENKTPPSTEREVVLARLWARVLHIGQEMAIGVDDSFFRLGGDSIGAMRLTTLARESEILLTVADIFTNPRLEDMAANSVLLTRAQDFRMEPFMLLQGRLNADRILKRIQKQYHIQKDAIEDAFPVTPLQEGLMSLSVKQPGSYMSQITLSLRPEVDIDHFMEAWQVTAERNSVLRSRLAYADFQTVQFVVKEHIDWKTGSDLEAYLVNDKRAKMGLGKPLTRFAIIDTGDDERYFVLTAHHSLYDGWSLMLVMEELDHLFQNDQPRPAAPQYATFIEHLRMIDLDAARSYWQAQFSDKVLATFPDPRLVTQATTETSIAKITELTRPSGSDITLSTVMRAAWALITARHANTNDVFFGATLMGRNASLPNIERITGPTITTVPVCVSISGSKTINKFLRQVQDQATEMIPFEHTGLQNIKRFGSEAEEACNFQNLLVIQPDGSEDINSNLWKETALFAKGEMVTLTYALIVECRLYKDKVKITAQYRDNVIPTKQMHRLVNQFVQVMHQLNNVAASNTQTVNNISMISGNDVDEILGWNKETLQISNSEDCIHRIIAQQAIKRPQAQAVNAWDESFTYSQLTDLSNKLSHHLKALGLGPNQFVPLCFNKSAWAIVGILAVLKSGAAYVPLDPKYPKKRRDHIIQEVSAKIILLEPQHRNLFDSSAYSIQEVDRESVESLPDLGPGEFYSGSPNDAAFLVFTSGSTGTPKAICMEHRAFCNSSREHSKALGINSESRVMQFAAYTYDVSMGEILTTLMQGGCVCVPSEEDRMSRLAASINTLRVNWLFLTPTVAHFIEPSDVPGLKVLVLGGEHATAENIRVWSQKVNLINSYGPAECAIWCACSPNVDIDADPACIGKPVGATLWITDAADPNKLAPIGCIGELVVEGQTLAREYLNNAAKTSAAFIENPKWSDDGSGKRRRMYRTGDLVRYGPDGSILFAGRVDTQVKIHGQRVELGEIEYHLKTNCPPAWFSAVEVLSFPRSNRDAIVCAFIQVAESSSEDLISGEIALPLTDALNNTLNQLRSELEEALPPHMVPAAYVPMHRIPLTAGGKVDRIVLRKLGESLTDNQLLRYMLVRQGVLRLPSTDSEKTLQKLWAKVLSLETSIDTIGLDSNFLRIGGDSIAAMRLSAAARDHGLLLTVKTIFTSPKLEHMSKSTTPLSLSRPATPYSPYSSLKVKDTTTFLKKFIYPGFPEIAGIAEKIADVLPATDYQRWTLGCGQLKTGGYNNSFIFHLKGPVDVQGLQLACQELVNRHTILRTVFVARKRQLYQVVLKQVDADFIHYEVSGTSKIPRSILENDIQKPVDINRSNVRFILVKHGPDESHLLMRASHSQYDGISLPIIVRDLKATYSGHDLSSSLPYSSFLHGSSQVMRDLDAETFWRKELEGSVMTSILSHSQPTYRNPVNSSLKQLVAVSAAPLDGITFATIVKTAWSLVLSQYSGVSDVVFGQISTGRNGPIQGIDEIVGPCMNLLPVRAKIWAATTLKDLLRQVQGQHLDMSPYESLGFQHIIENCTEWPKWTRFSSILQHTNFNVGMNDIDAWNDVQMTLGNFTPDHDVSDVWIWTGPSNDGCLVDFTYSSEAISKSTAQTMLDNLCNIITVISKTPEAPVSAVFFEAKIKLPMELPAQAAGHSDNTHHSEYNFGGQLESLVEKAWGKIYGDESDDLPPSVTIDMPWFELRGDMVAAAQLSMAYRALQTHVTPEDIIDNPSMRLQAAMLRSRA